MSEVKPGEWTTMVTKEAYESLTAELEACRNSRDELQKHADQCLIDFMAKNAEINDLKLQLADRSEKYRIAMDKGVDVLDWKLKQAIKALEIAANQLEGVSLAIKCHGQNINVQFFIETCLQDANKARETLTKLRGGV